MDFWLTFGICRVIVPYGGERKGLMIRMKYKLYLYGVLAVFIVGMSAFQSPSFAQDTSLSRLFSVIAIAVDESAVDASVARENAIKKAEMLAYQKLIHRLVSFDDIERIPPVSVDDLRRWVSGIEVQNEASSRRRYRAEISISFMPEPIMAHWTAAGVGFSLNAGPPLCLALSHREDDIVYLWEANNFAKQVWLETDWRNGLRRYDFMEPKLKLRAKFDALWLWSQPLEAADLIAQDCADDMVALVMTEMSADKKTISYRYFLTNIDMQGQGGETIDKNETATDVLKNIYSEIQSQIDENWRKISIVEGDSLQTISFLIAVDGLQDFVDAKRKLEGLSIVSAITADSIGLPNSQVTVSYTGNFEQFQLGLEQIAYQLVEWGDTYMLMKRD